MCSSVRGLLVVGTLAAVGVGVVARAEAQVSDTTPAKIVTMSFTPNAIDVTAGSRSVTVTARITDNLAGVSYGYGYFTSPSGQQTNYAFLSRISGSGLDGMYQGIATFPQFSEAGVWKLGVYTYDLVGNYGPLTTANLASLGIPTDLTVASTPDTHPPVVTAASITPGVIDVSTGARDITLELQLADDLSGVNSLPYAYLYSPTLRQYWSLSLVRVSGTPLNGIWRGTRSIPRYSETGTWQVYYVYATDAAGNYQYSYASIVPAVAQAVVTVQSTPSDTTAPQLTALAFSPPVFDTSDGERSVTASIALSDNLAGVSPASDTFRAQIRFTSPSGQQLRYGFTPTRSAGTDLNGTWQLPVSFPRYSEAGTWKAELWLVDGVANQRYFAPGDLTARGFPSSIDIFRPSEVRDAVIGIAGGTVTDSVFGSRASVTFPPLMVTQPTDVAIDVLSTPLNVPTPAGFSDGTLFVNIDLEPKPAMPLPPPGLLVTIPFTTFRTPGRLMYLYRFDPVTGGLVPAIGVNRGHVQGRVNSDGFSATFTGVARLSTVVGFFPTAVPGDVDGSGVVDCADVALVKASFGKRTGQAGFNPGADINQNGVVDVSDLSAVTRLLPTGTVCQ